MTLDELRTAPLCFGGMLDGSWTDGPAIVLPLAAIAAVYAAGALRLWHRADRGRHARIGEGLLFASGWGVLSLALVSPLHPLGERLFTAHMLEHELLMAVAAPLLVLSRPLAALLWGLPVSWRRQLAWAGHASPVACVWRIASRPSVATLLHGAAIWLWHLPTLFEAALAQGVLHYLQHASFLGTGLLFWWVVLPRSRRQPEQGVGVMHLFFTALHTGLLGVLLVLAPNLWYPANAADSGLWGLTPLEDQQLAGLVMWVPAGLIYAGAALVLAGLWIQTSGRLTVPEAEHA
ncbi:MAG: cytochrome c oxidase assembly protein [Geminicoccaceae bacterium]